jgi:hypothetical protein
MITDGVLEAPNKTGELFGRERLANLLHNARNQVPQTLVPAIIRALREHTSGARLRHDDVSLLMIEFVDNLKNSTLWTALRNRFLPRRSARNAFKATLPAIP